MKRTVSSFRPLGALTELDVGEEAVFVLVDVDLANAGDRLLHCRHVSSPILFCAAYAATLRLACSRSIKLAKGLEEASISSRWSAKSKAYADRALRKLRRHAHGGQAHARPRPCRRSRRWPELTATPARSSPINSVSALTPGTAKQLVLASRATFAESTTASGASATEPRLKLVAKRCDLARLARSAAASSAATPKSDNARRHSRCRRAGAALGPPPLMRGSTRGAFAEHQSADALGTADLVRREAQQVGTERG